MTLLTWITVFIIIVHIVRLCLIKFWHSMIGIAIMLLVFSTGISLTMIGIHTHPPDWLIIIKLSLTVAAWATLLLSTRPIQTDQSDAT